MRVIKTEREGRGGQRERVHVCEREKQSECMCVKEREREIGEKKITKKNIAYFLTFNLTPTQIHRHTRTYIYIYNIYIDDHLDNPKPTHFLRLSGYRPLVF